MQPKGRMDESDIDLFICVCVCCRHSLPCVPYLGPMLNELVIMLEVSPTFLESSENNHKVVNFNKMRQVWAGWP